MKKGEVVKLKIGQKEVDARFIETKEDYDFFEYDVVTPAKKEGEEDQVVAKQVKRKVKPIPKPKPTGVDALTEKQRAIFDLLVKGYSQTQAAVETGAAPPYANAAFKKCLELGILNEEEWKAKRQEIVDAAKAEREEARKAEQEKRAAEKAEAKAKRDAEREEARKQKEAEKAEAKAKRDEERAAAKAKRDAKKEAEKKRKAEEKAKADAEKEAAKKEAEKK